MSLDRKEEKARARKWETPALTVLAFRDTHASLHKKDISNEGPLSGNFVFS